MLNIIRGPAERIMVTMGYALRNGLTKGVPRTITNTGKVAKTTLFENSARNFHATPLSIPQARPFNFRIKELELIKPQVKFPTGLPNPKQSGKGAGTGTKAAAGVGLLGAAALAHDYANSNARHKGIAQIIDIYEEEIKPVELKPEKDVAVVSKLPDGSASSAVIHQNHYVNHPEEVAVLIAGGTGDIAYYSIIQALKSGFDVTFTSRKENPYDTPEMAEIIKKLTPKQLERLHYVLTPTSQDEWVNLITKVSTGKKEVQFNNLLGVPVQQNCKEAYDKALNRSEMIAKAAAQFETTQGNKMGIRIQLNAASSPVVDMLPDDIYAKFKKEEEKRVLQYGPTNCTLIRVPYIDGPGAPTRKSTAFGLAFTAFLPIQPLGGGNIPLPVTSSNDIGEAFSACVDGKFVVTAVGHMTNSAELTEAMTKAYGNQPRPFVLPLKITEKICDTINIGHATNYAYRGVESQMAHPMDVSDSNLELLLGHKPQNVVELFEDVAAKGKVLPPQQLRSLIGWADEEYRNDPARRKKCIQTIKECGPELASLAISTMIHYPGSITDVFQFTKELVQIAMEEDYNVKSY